MSFVFPKYKRPLTAKAKWYLEQYPNVNEAFNRAKFDDNDTISSLCDQGVDINFDVNAPNKHNMFHWSVTAHGSCNPYFLKLMFMKGRTDIRTDGQNVFEMSCAFGDSRHINVFMCNQDEYKFDVFLGMRSAVMHRNRDNLHHLLIFKKPTKDEVSELWDLVCTGFSATVPLILYFDEFFGCTITKEKLIESMPQHFYETSITLIVLYLGVKGNEPFKIDVNLVQLILTGTDDRLLKLNYLNNKGFEVEEFENIKNTPENELPKASMRRYYVNTM